MPRSTNRNARLRAIAVPRDAVRAGWTFVLGIVGLLLLLAAASAALARDGRPVSAVVDELSHAGATRIMSSHDSAAPVVADHDDEAQSFTRAGDRTRRTAGRAGVPVRRDGRTGSALLPTDVVLDLVQTGGPAPFGTPAANTPPSRGTSVHGVRGPPSLVSQAG